MRIGHGYDAHRFAAGRPLILGGVTIPHERGLLGHSDADVLAHAVIDALLGKWLKTDKPILGICRGLQFLNVYFGGTLYQDIPVECGVIHSDVVHKVRLEEGTWMRNLFDSAEIVTNSHHHQGVKKLADDFVVAGRSEDGMIEAAIHKSLPIFATQFHPERMIGDWRPEEQTDMTVIFDKFMDMVGRK